MRYFLIVLFVVSLFRSHAQENRMLFPNEMRHDLNVLQNAWTHLHPGIYRFNTRFQIDSLFEKAINETNYPFTEKEFYLLISKMATSIKCGHTYLNPLNLDSLTASLVLPKRVIPLFYKIINNRFYVTHNLTDYTEIEAGDEIVSINGNNINSVIDSLLMVSRGDGNNSLGKRINNMNESFMEGNNFSLFDIYFPLFFPNHNNSISITLKKLNSGKTISFKIPLKTIEERRVICEKKYYKIPTYEYTWQYKIISTTAYMKFGTFAFWNSSFSPQKYIDSIFSDVFSKPTIQKLIIDIRGNEGGDNSGDKILSYITQKAIGCEILNKTCYRYLAIPDSLLPYLSTWDNSFKKPKDPNQYFCNEIGLYEMKQPVDCSPILPAKQTFKGKCILLTDATNSSAGFEMARNFKLGHLGTIIGETTGGSMQGINGGEFFFLTLPESHLEIDLPLIYNYHPNQPDNGIEPDIQFQVSPTDIHNHIDGVINYCLKNL